MGVLTQTIIPSPVIKQILQARIRDKQKNDVLFIGEHYVLIRELLNGHLQDISRKADFGSRIRHAAVFGSARRHDLGDVGDGFTKEDSDTEMDYGSNLLSAGPPQERGIGWRELPPNILILALECGDLIFLFAHRQGGNTDFITYRKPLIRSNLFLEYPGSIIAVDPKSRAFAVAACKNSFSIFSLHPIDKIASDVEGSDGFISANFNPVKEERHFNLGLQAVIHKMDFLYPDPNDEEHVIMVVIFFLNQKTLLAVYRWESTQSLRSITHPNAQAALKKGKQVHQEISEDKISIYSNILPAAIKVLTLSIPHEKPSPFHNGQGAPLWTAWTRPVRTDKYSSTKDCIYIGREDGLLNYLEMDQDQRPLTPNALKLGLLECNIDTAFASLDLGVDRDDMLISGGDMGTGALYIVKPRRFPVYIQEVPNWTSVIDFTISKPSKQQAEVVSRNNSERIFACTGIQTRGCVSEIRVGLQARMGATITYLAGITSIWSLPERGETGLLILFAFLEYSSLLYVPFGSPDNIDNSSSEGSDIDPEGPQEISADACGLDLGSRTLAVISSGPYILQITETSIRATVYAGQPPGHYSSIVPEIYLTGEKIFTASIDEVSSTIALAMYKDGFKQIKLAQFNLQEG
ncbi:MAG: hypothetical protein M1829_002201 [Trizodia sp. TS-e1964]|nr:MAG: hypothetical protein M1829_002201 [Trizodia sp. TS-e1964]